MEYPSAHICEMFYHHQADQIPQQILADRRNVNALSHKSLQYSCFRITLKPKKENAGKTVITSWCHRPFYWYFFFFFFSFHNSSSAFLCSKWGWISSSRAEQVTVHRLCVQKRCTAEANLDEMQLPLDWQSHQMSFTLSWSILYTMRLFTTELQ